MGSNNKPIALASGGRFTIATDGSQLSNTPAGSIGGLAVANTPPTTILNLLGYNSNTNQWEPTNPPSIEPGLTIVWPMPVNGQIGYVSGNDTLSLAQANSYTTSQVYGLYYGTGAAQVSGIAPVFVQSGLTLTAGDQLFLSPTVAGAATNVAPSSSGQILAPLGVLQSTVGYNSMTGSALPVLWNPYPPVEIV